MKIKESLLRGLATGIGAGAVISVMAFCVIEGLNSEAARQDAVRQYNCTHYGAAINKHYGQELCETITAGPLTNQ
ncbi:MAG: hypothetical protein ACPGQQ_02730 [Candidatus Puniceispirillaceae bacterium]